MRTALVIALILLALLCVIPVVLVVGDSFVSSGGGLTLEHYQNAFSRAYRFRILFESLLIGLLSTLFAIALGLPYAFFSARVGVPLRGVFSSLYVLPLVLPPLLMTMGWTQFLNVAAERLSMKEGVQAFGGVGGASFLLGMAYFPFVTLFARKAFLETGAGLEEAARVTTGPVRAFLRVTLPLALPAILAGALFVFLFAISDFSVVDYLSTMVAVKNRVNAYTFEAFSAWSSNWEQQSGQREAAALSAPIAVISLALLLLIFLLIRKDRHVSVTSGHVRPRDVEDQSPLWAKVSIRSVGFLFLSLVLLLSVGIPLGRTLIEANGSHGIAASLRAAMAEGEGGGLHDLLNSLWFALAAGVGMTALAAVLAHHMVRKGPRREALILVLSFLPLAFGPILFGAGLRRTWNHTWLEVDRLNYVYDTWLIVVVMLIGKYLPFALAAATSTMRRIDRGYEEAAAVAGVGRWRRFGAVVAPLAARGIFAGFVLGFVFSLRELDTIVMLNPDSRQYTAMMKIYTWVHVAYESNVAALSLMLILLIALPILVYSLITAKKLRVF